MISMQCKEPNDNPLKTLNFTQKMPFLRLRAIPKFPMQRMRPINMHTLYITQYGINSSRSSTPTLTPTPRRHSMKNNFENFYCNLKNTNNME